MHFTYVQGLNLIAFIVVTFDSCEVLMATREIPKNFRLVNMSRIYFLHPSLIFLFFVDVQ